MQGAETLIPISVQGRSPWERRALGQEGVPRQLFAALLPAGQYGGETQV